MEIDISTVRRHLPVWTVMGTPSPTGTPVRTKEPLASVIAKVTKSPIEVVDSQVGAPGDNAGSRLLSLGTKTITFARGFKPAGSNTLPRTVVAEPQLVST
ncbi:MAG TPA: hypothetical protein VK762_07955, partial [Polyangiaceae bacterium]|nr:hypothetical protein [Polyangiaceae bacterium]